MKVRMRHTYNGYFDEKPIRLIAGETVDGPVAEHVAGRQPDWVEILEGDAPKAQPRTAPPADKMVRPGEGVAKVEKPDPAEAEAAESEEEPALADLQINQLRRLAAQRGIDGAGSMSKDELLEALKGE